MEKVNTNSGKINTNVTQYDERNSFWIGVGIILVILLLLAIGIFVFSFNKIYIRGESRENIPQKIYNENRNIADPSPEYATPTTVITPLPTSTPIPTKQALITIGFNVVDRSNARQGEADLANINVKLYTDSGTLLGEKPVPPVVYEGNIGHGGNALFTVPFGSYKAVAGNTHLTGTVRVTVQSSSDQVFFSIPMTAKDMHVKGKYFIDRNKNRKYDDGEPLCKNKTIWASLRMANNPGQLYSAGETKTDDNGDFSFTFKDNVGSYAMVGEYVGEYGFGFKSMEAPWIDLQGGDSREYNIYLWPI